MESPPLTSELLALQEATNAELRARLGEIFKRHRSAAFLGRNDNLFTENWTPEVAASGYDFDGFEIKSGNIVLHGVENACGFIYRIAIAFPLSLIDDAVAIEAYFQKHAAEKTADSALATATSGPSANSSAV